MSGGFAAVPCMSQIKSSENYINFKNKANMISVVLGRFYHREKKKKKKQGGNADLQTEQVPPQ